MKIQSFLAIMLVLMLALLTSCDALNGIVQKLPDQADMRAIEITLEPTSRPIPSCPDLSSFGYLSEYWPGGNTFPSTWKFTWFYLLPPNKSSVDEWLDHCVPESYSLVLSTGPDFEDEFVVPVTNPTVSYDITKVTIDWYFNYPLEDMKTYRWIAEGHYGVIDIGTDRIPQLHEDSRWIGLFPRNKSSFRTGPQCPSGAIDIPVLSYPVKGEIVSNLKPKFTWEISTCMPLVFMTQLSKNPDLQNLEPGFQSNAANDYSFWLQTNYPWLDLSLIGNSMHSPLADCSQYYWRVMSGIDVGGYYGTREWGEWSPIQSFYVNSGSCPTPTPTIMPPTRTPTPTPTVTPKPVSVNCSSYTDPITCNNHSQCFWHIYPPTEFKPAVCEDKP